MTDDELIGYADIHCETPRALFSNTHLRRLLELGGWPVPDAVSRWPDGWHSAHADVMKSLLAEIRAKRAAGSPS